MTVYRGGCQCGALAFEIELDSLDGGNRCNCSRCGRTGIIWKFAPRDAMTITGGEGATSVYRFASKTIEHHFCPTCGIEPFATGTTPDGRHMAAANIRCIEGVDIETLETNFVDGASS